MATMLLSQTNSGAGPNIGPKKIPEKILEKGPEKGPENKISFCVFSRTEEALKKAGLAQLLLGFFPAEVASSYRTLSDLLFCEVFPEWKQPCLRFYALQGGRIYSYNVVTPKKLLEWDTYLAETVIPRMKDLYLRGRRRWATVAREVRLPVPPPKRISSEGTLKKLPTSLGLHKACSEALETARLRGVLCRLIHELVEAARFDDPVWFTRSMNNTKNFVESLAPNRFGVRTASKVLLERIHYVSQLPQYKGVRLRLYALLQEYSFESELQNNGFASFFAAQSRQTPCLVLFQR